MYNFLLKNGTAIAMGIGSLITVLFVVSVLMGLSSSGYDTSTDLLQVDYKSIKAFNLGIYLTGFLSVIAILLMLGGIIWELARSGKSSLKMVSGIIALVLIFVIFYFTSKYDTGGRWDYLNSEFKVGENASKFISAGIWTTGILLVVSALTITIAEVRNFFK